VTTAGTAATTDISGQFPLQSMVSVTDLIDAASAEMHGRPATGRHVTEGFNYLASREFPAPPHSAEKPDVCPIFVTRLLVTRLDRQRDAVNHCVTVSSL
jgi:hypothetical protein